MSQQQMDFEPNRGGSTSYETGYQEATHDDSPSHFPEQKLSWQDAAMQPTSGQRLALAIVSLLVLFLMFLSVVVLAITGALAVSTAQYFVPVFIYMGLGLLAAVITVNVVFNRKR